MNFISRWFRRRALLKSLRLVVNNSAGHEDEATHPSGLVR
jgi:hypothetical protein